MRVFSLALLVLGISISAFARGGGGGGGSMHLGANFGLLTAGQDDLNYLQQQANTRYGGITTSQLGSAYELSATWGYRFSGTMFEMMFRPSYFWHSVSGNGSGSQAVEYGVKGFTLYPMLRIIPLENAIMKFFFQVGVGYGKLTGTIKENTYSAEFAGSTFGYLAGLGTEICFTDSHCMVIEGNLRGMPVERSEITSVSGTVTGTGLSQGNAVGDEVEMGGRDLKVTGSGILANLGYVMRF